MGAWREFFGGRQMVSLCRDHMAHPAAGITHVTLTAWDYVDVEVRDRLPRRWAVVVANIESIRIELTLQQGPAPLNAVQERLTLGRREVVPSIYVPQWHDKQMALRDGEGVTDRKDGVSAERNTVGLRPAEWTRSQLAKPCRSSFRNRSSAAPRAASV
jgi:hypothetical protein